jgi:hypothetical protein
MTAGDVGTPTGQEDAFGCPSTLGLSGECIELLSSVPSSKSQDCLQVGIHYSASAFCDRDLAKGYMSVTCQKGLVSLSVDMLGGIPLFHLQSSPLKS